MDFFDTPLISTLSKSLDGLWQRGKVIQDNLGNYETPGYKRKVVSFEDQLKSALEQNRTPSQIAKEITQIEPRMSVTSTEQNMRLDGNSVDVEQENIELARAQYQYDYALRLLSDQFSRLRSAISEGKK